MSDGALALVSRKGLIVVAARWVGLSCDKLDVRVVRSCKKLLNHGTVIYRIPCFGDNYMVFYIFLVSERNEQMPVTQRPTTNTSSSAVHSN